MRRFFTFPDSGSATETKRCLKNLVPEQVEQFAVLRGEKTKASVIVGHFSYKKHRLET